MSIWKGLIHESASGLPVTEETPGINDFFRCVQGFPAVSTSKEMEHIYYSWDHYRVADCWEETILVCVIEGVGYFWKVSACVFVSVDVVCRGGILLWSVIGIGDFGVVSSVC